MKKIQENLGPATQESHEPHDPHLGLYVAEHVLRAVNSLYTDFEFLQKDNALFKQLRRYFKEIVRRRNINLDEVREVHQDMMNYLQSMEQGVVICIKRNEGPPKGKRFKVPAHMKNFDEIVERIRSQRKKENLEEAMQSAVDCILMGEMSCGEIRIDYRLKIRQTVITVLKESVESQYIESQYTDDDEKDKIKGRGIDRLLKLTDPELEKLKKSEHREIIKVILKVRADIRGGYSKGTPTKEQRLKEAAIMAFRSQAHNQVPATTETGDPGSTSGPNPS